MAMRFMDSRRGRHHRLARLTMCCGAAERSDSQTAFFSRKAETARRDGAGRGRVVVLPAPVRVLLPILFALVAVSRPADVANAQPDRLPKSLNGTVASIVEGDTLVLLAGGGRFENGLEAVEAPEDDPEDNEPLGGEAEQAPGEQTADTAAVILFVLVFPLAILFVMFLFVFFFVLRPWLRALLHSAPVSVGNIIGMRLRGNPPMLLIDAYISLKRKGHSATIADVEHTYIDKKGRVFTSDDLVNMMAR